MKMSEQQQQFFTFLKGEDRPISGAIFDFINVRNNDYFKKVCFVEGVTDKKFYFGVLYKNMKIKQEEVYYIYNQIEGGKEKVIKLYKYIKNNIPQSLSKCVFVVDKDYDDLQPVKYNLTEEEKNDITILPCYSFENYYLYNGNLKIIFKSFIVDNSDKQMVTFLYHFNQFVDDIKEYCALKRTIVRNNITGVKALKNIDNKDPIEKEFEENGYCNCNHNLTDIVNNTEQYITSRGEYIYHQYKRSTELFKKRPYLIKGKIAFGFLKEYLLKYHNIKMSDNEWYKLSELFIIELNIKQIDTPKDYNINDK